MPTGFRSARNVTRPSRRRSSDGGDPLEEARRHLALAESAPWSDDGRFHADEGLFLLEEHAEQTPAAARLGETYALRLLERVQSALAGDVPEPQLKGMLKLLQTLESVPFGDAARLATVRVMIAERLLDRYFEGYSDAERERAIQSILDQA